MLEARFERTTFNYASRNVVYIPKYQFEYLICYKGEETKLSDGQSTFIFFYWSSISRNLVFLYLIFLWNASWSFLSIYLHVDLISPLPHPTPQKSDVYFCNFLFYLLVFTFASKEINKNLNLVHFNGKHNRPKNITWKLLMRVTFGLVAKPMLSWIDRKLFENFAFFRKLQKCLFNLAFFRHGKKGQIYEILFVY